MAARIEHHRQGRPAHWRTVERWQHLDELIHADINPHEAVLLECVTTMVTNLLFDYGGDKDPDEWDYQAMEQAINAEIQSLIAACQRCPAKVVLVTNEVGMGIVPESRLARHFRDIAGRVNQQLAAAANEVWLVVSGIGVKNQMSKLFWAMLSFITRLPVPRRWSQGLDFEHYSRGIITFPLIGLLLGAISGLVFMVLQAWCGVPLAALFSVLVLALMTGDSTDGLADTCDGVFSARSRDRMLEIMRDSRLGTHGGLALIFVVLAKILVLSELALRGEPILASLAAACAVSRGTAALLMYRHRYAREEGLGNVFIGKIDGATNLRHSESSRYFFTAVLLPGMHGVAAMVVTMVAIFILGQLLKRTLGGQTGDTLGAAIELGELVFLLALL